MRKEAGVSAKANFNTPIDPSIVKDRCALVTGGASGLGKAIVRALAEAGAYVTIADIQEEAGTQLAKELQQAGHHVIFAKTDVTSYESQTQAFKTAIKHSPYRTLDIVVTSAGVGARIHHYFDPDNDHAPNADLDKDEPPPCGDHTIQINLVGSLYSARLAMHYFRLPATPAQGAPPPPPAPFQKALVFIASLAGYMNLPYEGHYTASKFGVRGFWQSLREKAPEVGARANLIAPWYTKTPMTVDMIAPMEKRGFRFSTVEQVVEGTMRAALDQSVSGRAIAIGPDGPFDLGDDNEGANGFAEMHTFLSRPETGPLI